MSALLQMLRDESGLEVFVGPPVGGFELLGKKFNYITFVNGKRIKDTDVAPFVGQDLPEDEKELMKFTFDQIIKWAKEENCKAIILREGAEGTLKKYDSFLDAEGNYRDGDLHYRVRVAFIV